MPSIEIAKSLPSPHCSSTDTRNRLRKTARGYRTFYCPACSRFFNEKTGTALNFLQYPEEVVLLGVLRRLRYKLSLTDLAEMLVTRGITFTHETVREWEKRFAWLITAKFKAERKEHLKKKPSQRWKVGSQPAQTPQQSQRTSRQTARLLLQTRTLLRRHPHCPPRCPQ